MWFLMGGFVKTHFNHINAFVLSNYYDLTF